MFIKCPCTCDHEYPSMHGLSSIVASRFRCKLKNLEFQTNGGSLTWYAPTATPLTPILTQVTSAKNRCFYQKIVTQSPVFSTLSKILETVHSKTPNRREKGTQMPPIQADCNGSDNELSEQSYVQSRSMRDRPVRHFAHCYTSVSEPSSKFNTRC